MGLADWFMGNKEGGTKKSETGFEKLDISPFQGVGLLLTGMATSALAKNAGLSDSLSAVTGFGGVASGIQDRLSSIEEDAKTKKKYQMELSLKKATEKDKTYSATDQNTAITAAMADFDRLTGGKGTRLLQHKDLKIKARAEAELAKLAQHYLTGEAVTVEVPYMSDNWTNSKSWNFEAVN